MGVNSFANGATASAFGQGAFANGDATTAVGQGSVAGATNATALGVGAQALATNSSRSAPDRWRRWPTRCREYRFPARSGALYHLHCGDRPITWMAPDRDAQTVQFIETHVVYCPRLSIRENHGFANEFELELVEFAKDSRRSLVHGLRGSHGAFVRFSAIRIGISNLPYQRCLTIPALRGPL
jgi:hypothetical protein